MKYTKKYTKNYLIEMMISSKETNIQKPISHISAIRTHKLWGEKFIKI